MLWTTTYLPPLGKKFEAQYVILSVAFDQRWAKLSILDLENPKWMPKYLHRVAMGVILKILTSDWQIFAAAALEKIIVDLR